MRINFAILLTLVTATCLAFTASATEFKSSIAFPHGKNSTIVKGNVVRGDRNIYTIRVRSGQKMSISISALENNAAFSIYEPKAEDALPGTEEEKDAKEWNGILTKTGEYQIVVGGTRGNASYQLKVKVE